MNYLNEPSLLSRDSPQQGGWWTWSQCVCVPWQEGVFQHELHQGLRQRVLPNLQCKWVHKIIRWIWNRCFDCCRFAKQSFMWRCFMVQMWCLIWFQPIGGCDDVPLLPNASIHQFPLDDHAQLVRHRPLSCSFWSWPNLEWRRANSS